MCSHVGKILGLKIPLREPQDFRLGVALRNKGPAARLGSYLSATVDVRPTFHVCGIKDERSWEFDAQASPFIRRDNLFECQASKCAIQALRGNTYQPSTALEEG